MGASSLVIEPGKIFSNPANPQTYLDNVSDVDNFFKLREKLNETITKIIMVRFDYENKHRCEIIKNIESQQYWKSIQAFTKLGIGVAVGGTSIVAGFVNDFIGSILKGVSQASQPLGDTAVTFVDGKYIPLHHEQQEYINTVSLDKQKQQQLRDLIKELQQNVMEIMRLQLQMMQRVQNER